MRHWPLLVILVLLILIGAILLAPYEPVPAAPSAPGQEARPSPSPSPSPTPGLGQRTKTTGCLSVGGLPDRACTPGAIDPRVTQANIGETICVSGYTAKVRPPASVTNQIKRSQLVAYGMASLPLQAVELDHSIPLELGGDPLDVANLWPEPYGADFGARTKDVLEGVLKRRVCGGQLALSAAQLAIATDWIAAYHRYVGP